MANRRATPNLLDPLSDIMGETAQKNNKAVKQGVGKEITHASGNEIKQSVNKVLKHDPEAELEQEGEGEEPKEKATFNLPIRLLHDLEDKWMDMRRLSGSKRISKTLIVEKALELALAEFEAKREASLFYGKLARNKLIAKDL